MSEEERKEHTRACIAAVREASEELFRRMREGR